MMKREPSQKFFTIQFCEDGSEDIKTTKVPAKKGKSLKDIIEPILSNHDISLDTHSVFLESSQTPLPLASETFPYGGSVLHIRANDVVNVDKRVVSMRRDNDNKSPDLKKRFSSLLSDFSENGFQDADQLDENCETDDGDGDDDAFFLETTWKDIIIQPEDMTDRQRVQQEAIWELLSTEVIYIKDLKIILDVFQKCFLELQKEGYLVNVDQSLIYANIEEVFQVNVRFWKLLKGVVDHTRSSKKPIKPSQLMESFDEFEELFQPYITFCNSDPSNMKLPTFDQQTNEMLKEYFTWCDNHEQCKRINLTGFLIKPLQRVTKYTLLIRAILSKTDDDEERVLLEGLKSRVETFVSKINSAVHMRQECEKLKSILSKFDSYNPVEPVSDEAEKIMNEYTDLDLVRKIPGLSENEKRFIIKDGPMKLIEKQSRKDVYTFLFSDVFVLTKLKKNADKYRVIRQPFRLNKVVLRVMKDPGSLLFIYLNEYEVMANAFVLQINTQEQAKWLLAFDQAKQQYEKTRLEYLFSKENLLDDEPTNSFLNKTYTQQLEANKKRKGPSQLSRIERDKSGIYQWTNTRIFIAATVFCLINIFCSWLCDYR